MSTKWRRVEPSTLSRKGGIQAIPAFPMSVARNIDEPLKSCHKKMLVKKLIWLSLLSFERG